MKKTPSLVFLSLLMFSLSTSAEQGVTEFRTQMEDAITSTRQLLGAFGLRSSHLARTFDAFKYSATEFGFEEKVPVSWLVARQLSCHMQSLVQLIIDLSPLCGDFTTIIQSSLEHLSFPSIPSSPMSPNPIPTSQMLRTLEHSIRHILQESRLQMNAMFSICASDMASAMKSPDISPDLDSRYSNWLCYLMSIDDDVYDLSRLLDHMFSIAAKIPDAMPYPDSYTENGCCEESP
ncbi:hypothetical protein OG21DRAFT_1525961 [Imleria badia]|nr:hypothetical protein OG21DRAFT_1525961 [Imleria badia]